MSQICYYLLGYDNFHEISLLHNIIIMMTYCDTAEWKWKELLGEQTL